MPIMSLPRLEPTVVSLLAQIASRQRPHVVWSSPEQRNARPLLRDDANIGPGARVSLTPGLQIQVERSFCSCSSWSPSSSNLALRHKSVLTKRQQQEQNLPRITVYNNDRSGGADFKNLPLKAASQEKTSIADKRQHRLSKSTKRLIEASEDLERAIRRAALNYRHCEHYDHTLYGLDPTLDQAVGRHQRETMLYNQDRHLKEEQAKSVAPNMRQSPIAIMTMNPTYELQNKPLIIEYPATLENLRLNNTGFSWEVKIPYQISMTTALYGAHLNTSYRYRLDQFHCHWGAIDGEGSEHTVDNKCYSAEMHFVHYNMEKYHTMSKAARHPDGLVVVSVFLDAQTDHHNHAELEKIVSHLKAVTLKGEHAIIRQAIRIENLLPTDKSYWSYQGSLTTPPYFESVTWFVLKHPIKCSVAQIQKFRNLTSSLRQDDEVAHIRSNHRKTQPLNGRTIVTYDETSGVASRSSHFAQ